MTHSSKRSQFLCEVIENRFLCREHYRLVLRVESFPPTEPGQFVQVSGRNPDYTFEENEIEWGDGNRPTFSGEELRHPLALLRRPFSLAGRRDTAAGVELTLIHRVVGVATEWLSHLKVGDAVGVLGPLGNQFVLPGANDTALMVGGGVGIPPMLYLASKLAGKNAVAFCGALTADLIPLTVKNAGGVDDATPRLSVEEFAAHGISSVITTDDGSVGFRGFVTQALEAYLDAHLAMLKQRGRVIVYTCGPEPMMKRVGDIAISRGIECQIAVERAMACGMGTCQSCVIKVRKGDGWVYKLACTDGPVFAATDLLW